MHKISKTMIHNTPIPEVPRLADFNYFSWHTALKKDNYDLLTLSKIEGAVPPLPEQYTPPTYAIEFVLRGNTIGKVNDRVVELHPNDAFFIMADSIHKEVATSPDCEIYIIGLSTQFTDMLNVQLSQSHLSHVLMMPVWHLSDNQMAIVLKYFDLLRILIEADKQAEVLHLVRSFLYNLAEDYALLQLHRTHSLSRAEQICGQYLSLIELHCRTQHKVEWYADQLHLSPKYLSNTVHQTLHVSPNTCIDQAILRQAKSLLSSTSLSVQQISDRLGFLNQSHFGTFFKRHITLSPSAFKSSAK